MASRSCDREAGGGSAAGEPLAVEKAPGMALAVRPQAQARHHRVDCPTCEAFPGRGDVVLDIEEKKVCGIRTCVDLGNNLSLGGIVVAAQFAIFHAEFVAPECEIPDGRPLSW